MKVYVNDRLEICDVGSTTDSTLTEYEVPNEDFEGWSIAKICCYKIYVSLGKYCGFSPYVSSNLIQHIDQLGQQTESNAESISETNDGLIETYEATLTNEATISECEDALMELYEMIIGE